MSGAVPSPYRDVQTLRRVVRRKRTERERLLDGELPTSNVYFTQFEQTDHQERHIIERIVERNVLLDEIYDVIEYDKENKPWPKSKALKALIGIRRATLAVVMAIRSWRVSVGDRPFLHRGENYLLTVRDDMDVLQDIDPVKHFGFFLGSRNPFVLPLRPLHVTKRKLGKRGEQKLLSPAEEDLAREFATVSRVDEEDFLVCHEYLVEEERARTKRKRGSRERKWGYDKWVGGLAWVPPPKPVARRRTTRRTMMTTWIAKDGGEVARDALPDPARDTGDATSLRRACSARDRSGERIPASRALRGTIARPNMSRNEWNPTERGPSKVGRVAPSSRPGPTCSRPSSGPSASPARSTSGPRSARAPPSPRTRASPSSRARTRPSRTSSSARSRSRTTSARPCAPRAPRPGTGSCPRTRARTGAVRARERAGGASPRYRWGSARAAGEEAGRMELGSRGGVQ